MRQLLPNTILRRVAQGVFFVLLKMALDDIGDPSYDERNDFEWKQFFGALNLLKKPKLVNSILGVSPSPLNFGKIFEK